MRIGMDYRPALFTRGGIARSVRELVSALSSLDDAPELALFGHGYRRPLPGTNDLPTNTRAKLCRSRLPGRALPALAAMGLDASRLVGPIDLFHYTDYVYPPVRESIPKVVTIHDLAFFEDDRFHGAESSEQLRDRVQAAVATATRVIVPSRATKAAVHRAFGAEQAVEVIPFGIDHVKQDAVARDRGRRLAGRLLGSDAPYVLSIGTIEPRKNHDSLLDACEILASEGLVLPLLVVGAPGWETERTQQRLASNGATHPLSWQQSLEDPGLFDLLFGARVLAYPSSLEGFGFPPLEALEAGVPTVIGRCDALREHTGAAGHSVDGRDARALANALRELYESDELRAQRLAQWQDRRSSYTWARAARSHLRVYESCMLSEVQ